MSESPVKELIGQRRRGAIFAVLIDILASSFPKKRHDHASSRVRVLRVCCVGPCEKKKWNCLPPLPRPDAGDHEDRAAPN